MYDYLIFIGRFEPFHRGHKKVIDYGLENSKKVVVLIGSSNSARSIRNPFTFEERKKMILESDNYQDRVIIKPLNDLMYNDQGWIRTVQKTVHSAILNDLNRETPNAHLHGLRDAKIGLIGLNKDGTSYYLKLFPEWDSINVNQKVVFNSTDIRNDYFTANPKISNFVVTPNVSEFLKEFLETEYFKNIYEEFKYIENYKKAWENSPYPPTFVTTDAVIIQSGYILLVKRKCNPGKGLRALPGGFLNPSEKIEDCMVRELREETKIKVPMPVLKGNIKKRKVFDDPNRSARGRTITHAFLIELPAMHELPVVKGGSDAAKAEWVALSELKAEEFFEDHWHIIQNLTGDI